MDYSTFPHLTCGTIEAKRNQSEKIKQRLLEADNREELTAIKQEFQARCRWVWHNLLTDGERKKLKAIANTEQLDLLSSAQVQVEESTAGAEVTQAVLFAPGDKIFHAELGEGIVEEQIRDMVFCQFACGKRSPWAWEVRNLD